MTKNDLTEAVRNINDYPKREADKIVESVLEIMKGTLASGKDVMISGFGKFAIQRKNARHGRNPQTGESLTITARKILTFKPSSLLKQEINGD